MSGHGIRGAHGAGPAEGARRAADAAALPPASHGTGAAKYAPAAPPVPAKPQPKIVAGFGFRSTATTASLRDALDRAGGADGVTVLATLASKADAPALVALAASLSLPIRAIAPAALAGLPTLTQSPASLAQTGCGSLAEAAALAAAGPGARLLAPRAISTDGQATAARATAAPIESPLP